MSYYSEVLADSPAAYFRLGEASGTTMVDYSGNGRNGSYFNSPTLGAPSLLASGDDAAVTLNGTNQYGEVPDAVWMDAAAATFEAIIKPTNVTSYRAILNRDTGSSATAGRSFNFRVSDAGKVQIVFWTATTGPHFATGATTLLSGGTYHVAATYDGTTMRVYLNGVLDGSVAAAGTLRTSNAPLNVGNQWQGGPRIEFFQGTLDEVAFYGSALSAARVAAHHAAATAAATVGGSLAATLPRPSISAAGTYTAPPIPGSLTGTLPVPTVVLAGSYDGPALPIDGALAASLPMPMAAIAGAFVPPLERVGFGMILGSTATVSAEEPLEVFAPAPGGVPDPVTHVVTPTVPAPVLVNGRPS